MDSDRNFPKYYNLRSAAEFCQVSVSAVRNWILTGRLRAEKPNSEYLILESDLKAIRDSRQAEAETEAQLASN